MLTILLETHFGLIFFSIVALAVCVWAAIEKGRDDDNDDDGNPFTIW